MLRLEDVIGIPNMLRGFAKIIKREVDGVILKLDEMELPHPDERADDWLDVVIGNVDNLISVTDYVVRYAGFICNTMKSLKALLERLRDDEKELIDAKGK